MLQISELMITHFSYDFPQNMMKYIDLSGVLFAGLAEKSDTNFSIDFWWSVQYHDIYQSDWIS